MRRLLALICLALLTPAASHAGKRKKLKQDVEDIGTQGPKANAGEIPALARLLARTGWAPTPELSGAFRPGFVFQDSELGHRLQLEDCFTAPATTSTYTAAEVVTQLQAGVSVSLGAGSVGAGGGIVKKVKFGTPEHHSVPMLKMVPTAACRDALLGARAAGIDLDTMYVVQEVLTARIAEQTCGRVDAHGNFVALGSAEVELAVACAQASLDPVAIAYRTTPVTALSGIRDAGAQASTPTPQANTPTPQASAPTPQASAPTPQASAPEPKSEPTPAAEPDPPERRIQALSTAIPGDMLIGSSDVPLTAFSGSLGGAGDDRVEGWKEERAEDPTGSSIYDSLTYANNDDPDAFEAALRKLPNPLFIRGTADLTGPGQKAVAEAAYTLSSFPDFKVRVEGHTNSLGASSTNQRLSEQRAQAVVDQLVREGIPRKRLRAVGYGETRPIASNDTEAGQARNSRVELHLDD